MRYAIAEAQLQQVLGGPAPGPDEPDRALELAWHLRQRDSARALQLVQALPAQWLASDWRHRVRAQLVVCELDALGGRLMDAEAHVHEVQALLAQRKDPLHETDALLAEAGVAKAQGDSLREVRCLERACSQAVRAGDFQRLGVAQGLLAGERVNTRVSAEGPPGELAGDQGDPACQALQMAADALGLWLRDPQQVARNLPRAAALAQDMGLMRLAIVCTLNAGNAWRVVGEFGLAAQELERALTLALRTGWPALVAMTQSQVGALLRHLGRAQSAQRLLQSALVLQRGLPAGPARANTCSELAETLMELGRGPEAAALMEEAVGLYRGFKARLNLPAALVRQSCALSLTGREADAHACIAEAQALAQEHGYQALSVELSLALASVHRRGRLPLPVEMQASSPTLHFALAAMAAGRRINGWRPPESLLVCLADAWADAGDMAQAYEHACCAVDERGRVMAQILGHAETVARLIALADQTRVPEAPRAVAVSPAETRAAPTADRDPLTPREQDVLGLLARGYTNKEIAVALELSGDTVKWHLKNLYTKLGSHSRRHVVMRARTLGLIGLDDEMQPVGA